GEATVEPSETFTKTLDPPSRDLVRRYLEHVGGDPDRDVETVPPHLFSQWTFDLLAKTLGHLTFPLHEMVNGGCRLEVDGELPLGRRLRATATLVEVDQSPSRLRFHHVIETGPLRKPDAVVAHMYNVLVRPTSSRGAESSKTDGGRKRDEPIVSATADEIERWELAEDAGLDFAKLTGDFNPIHWLRPAAKAAGFENTILHGFATMARAFEDIEQGCLAAGERIETLDVRFTNPLVLPADVGLYVGPGEEEDECPVY
ncbi:MAG: MaoC/PaaZ C-terminal domain-containing protein, partial [Bradymonadaceae bacterium]